MAAYFKILILVTTLSFNSLGQKDLDFSLEFKPNGALPQDSIVAVIKQNLGNDWFLVENETGFKVYFCRSCEKEYITSKNRILRGTADWPTHQSRDEFLNLDALDSVAYFPTVSRAYLGRDIIDSLREIKLREIYKADGILFIEVKFDSLWSKNRYDSIQINNDLLHAKILEKPLYKTSLDIFSYYRFWLPDAYFKSRTTNYSFYFERLPYHTDKLDYSIFIIQDKPYFFSEACFVDKDDSKYFYNHDNFLEKERRRTLTSIALIMGIPDFKIVN